MANLYILKYVHTETCEKGSKNVVFFMNLNTAFDNGRRQIGITENDGEMRYKEGE